MSLWQYHAQHRHHLVLTLGVGIRCNFYKLKTLEPSTAPVSPPAAFAASLTAIMPGIKGARTGSIITSLHRPRKQQRSGITVREKLRHQTHKHSAGLKHPAGR